jgi:hypothetical protein
VAVVCDARSHAALVCQSLALPPSSAALFRCASCHRAAGSEHASNARRLQSAPLHAVTDCHCARFVPDNGSACSHAALVCQSSALPPLSASLFICATLQHALRQPRMPTLLASAA